MDALSDEQKRVLSQFDEIEKAAPIPKEEVEEFINEVEKTIGEMFEDAREAHDVEGGGGYRRGDPDIKEADILIIRKDEGPPDICCLNQQRCLKKKE